MKRRKPKACSIKREPEPTRTKNGVLVVAREGDRIFYPVYVIFEGKTSEILIRLPDDLSVEVSKKFSRKDEV